MLIHELAQEQLIVHCSCTRSTHGFIYSADRLKPVDLQFQAAHWGDAKNSHVTMINNYAFLCLIFPS